MEEDKVNKLKTTENIVVFDLDETLGYFVQLGMFCDGLKEYFNKIRIDGEYFATLLTIYPEVFRPNIIPILEYVKQQKKKGKCSEVLIYTNNQGPKYWAQMIKEALEKKLNYPLFKQIIAAFKVNGRQVEMCRTSHEKSISDLLRCTKVPASTRVCFLDDQYHEAMQHDKVFYINVSPYVYNYSFTEMIDRYLQNPLGKDLNKVEFKTKMLQILKQFHFTETPKEKTEYEVDKIVGKQVLKYLKEFFGENKVKGKRKERNTQYYKRKHRKRRKTQKK